ncbi:hypothetical protein [Streptomyces sp. SID3343]|uniref:hypothetical protein n=1 Tax=Streptomyces sp. SID3343 TaxID=2690260 RepID=UPI001371737C|nr:hypothetical protein [Streptomyces sp. SID3343]MYV98088.1 hypothetical protein [Streptomyces sp. SID3343]
MRVPAVLYGAAFLGLPGGGKTSRSGFEGDASRRPEVAATAPRSPTQVVDVLSFGFLRPPWNAENKTFSDGICGSIVVSKY